MEGASFSICRTVAEQVWWPREKQNVAHVEASKLSMHKPHIIDRRQWQGTGVVGFHLWWTEAPICILGLLSRLIHVLPGAQIQDVAEELPRILGYRSLLPIQMGTNNTARGDQWGQKCLQGSDSKDQELQAGQPAKILDQGPLKHISGPMQKKVIRKNHHGFSKGQSCLSNLIAVYDKMTGLVDKGREWMSLTLPLALVSPFKNTLPSLNLKNKNYNQ